jgi:hypothetical protein
MACVRETNWKVPVVTDKINHVLLRLFDKHTHLEPVAVRDYRLIALICTLTITFQWCLSAFHQILYSPVEEMGAETLEIAGVCS